MESQVVAGHLVDSLAMQRSAWRYAVASASWS